MDDDVSIDERRESVEHNVDERFNGKPASALLLFGMLACAACDSSSASGSGSAASDACVPYDASYECLGGKWPTCPIVVWDVPSPLAGCDFSVPSCFRCDGIAGMNVPPMTGTGATCVCRDAGYPIPDGSTGYWDCVGTGSTCQ